MKVLSDETPAREFLAGGAEHASHVSPSKKIRSVNPPVTFSTKKRRVRLAKHGGVAAAELTPNRNTRSRAYTPATSVDASAFVFIHASTHFINLSLTLSLSSAFDSFSLSLCWLLEKEDFVSCRNVNHLYRNIIVCLKQIGDFYQFFYERMMCLCCCTRGWILPCYFDVNALKRTKLSLIFVRTFLLQAIFLSFSYWTHKFLKTKLHSTTLSFFIAHHFIWIIVSFCFFGGWDMML